MGRDVDADDKTAGHLTKIIAVRISEADALMHHNVILFMVDSGHTERNLTNYVAFEIPFVEHRDLYVCFLNLLVIHLLQIDEKVLVEVY